MWCGRDFEDHLDSRAPGSPVPRMPCLFLKSGFRLKDNQSTLPPPSFGASFWATG